MATELQGDNISNSLGTGAPNFPFGFTSSGQPLLLAKTTAAQTYLAASTSPVTVLFGAAVFDTTNSFNTGTGVYTAPKTGYYLINFNVYFNQGLSGSTQVFFTFLVNGSSYGIHIGYFAKGTGASFDDTLSGSAVIQLTAADTFELQFQKGVAQSNNGQLGDAGSGVNPQSTMSISLVG